MNYLEIALSEAKKAAAKGEVPIGAVIVHNGKIIAKAHNLREKRKNALAHAEILAINKACKKLHNWRLSDCDLYVTLEPCQMCMGAIRNARIRNVVCGAKAENLNLNHNFEVSYEENKECCTLLKDFFANKRN